MFGPVVNLGPNIPLDSLIRRGYTPTRLAKEQEKKGGFMSTRFGSKYFGCILAAAPILIGTSLSLANSEIKEGESCSYDWQCQEGDLCIDGVCTTLQCDGEEPGTIRWENGEVQVCTGTSWAGIVARAPRAIDEFSGNLGPDLGKEGYTQCYGWKNDGSHAGLNYEEFRTACGRGVDLVFAGYRAGEPTLVRHNVRLSTPLEDFLPLPVPSGVTFYHHFDPEGRFTWAFQNSWLLLSVQGNTWSDPGRLWEPNVNGGTSANSGHVLSQYGMNANDQREILGDRYFVYYRH